MQGQLHFHSQGEAGLILRRFQQTRFFTPKKHTKTQQINDCGDHRVAVHLKRKKSSIKQSHRNRPNSSEWPWISHCVRFGRDKWRSSSVWPRLPIDRDHHSDVAFYLTALLPKALYYSPHRDIKGGRGGTGGGGGGGGEGWERRTRRRWQEAKRLLVLFVPLHLADIHSVWGRALDFGRRPRSTGKVRLDHVFTGGVCRCTLLKGRLGGHRGMGWSRKPVSPSPVVLQTCQIRLRGKPPGWVLIRAIMEFYANKLPWLTVTVQWLGPTCVTWPQRASSLSEAIMTKWSFAIELRNDEYWLVLA